MKNIFLFLVFVSCFSFVGLCSFDYDDTVTVNTVYLFTWSGFNEFKGRFYQPAYNVSSVDQMRSIYLSGTFGFSLKTNRTTASGYNFSFQCPYPGFSFVEPGNRVNITNSVVCLTNNVLGCVSPLYFREIASLYQTAATLFLNGYTGSGFPDVFPGSSGRVCINVDFPTLVSDVLSSTNTAFRSSLLSSLSDVNGSLSMILQSLSDIASRPSSSSEIWDYDKITNYLSSADGNIYIDGILFPSEEVLYQVVHSPLKDSSSPSDRAQYENYVQSVGRALPLLQSLSGLGSLLSGNSIGQSSDHSGLELLGNQFNKSVNDNLSSIGGHVGSIASRFNRLSTNDWASVVTNQLAQNTRDAKKQLKDNHDSITNQLAHMFDDNPNSVGRAIRNTANNTAASATAAGQIANALSGSLSVHVTDTVGVSLDGPVDINNSQFQDVTVPLGNVSSTLSNFYNDWYQFWDISTPAYSWGNFYNMVRDFKDQNHSDIASITNLPFFSAVSNSLASIDNFLQTNSFSSSLHALLLDDYADYITNRFYSSAVDTFKDDYPSVYTNLVKFGLSTEDGEGNFWSLISSTLFYQSALVCGMLEDLATVRQFAEDHIDGGFSGGVTSLIEKMPSSTELADRVNQASNEVFKIEAAANSFYTAYSSMTNSGISAFSPFRGIFSSVPENVVFFKTGNDQYITIPVSEGGNAWSVIRLCFSFSLVAVNVILFPKFVLMVIVLLSKLSKRFVKFVPTDAM